MEKPKLLHVALAPLYLGAATLFGAMANGIAPAGALLAAGAAAAAAVVPAAIFAAGRQRESGRLMRLALVAAIGEILALGWLASPGRVSDYGIPKLDEAAARARLAEGAGPAFDRTVEHAKRIAALGPRQTGTPGLEKAFAYVAEVLAARGWTQIADGNPAALADPPPERVVRRTNFPVTVALDEGSAFEFAGADGAATNVTAYALQPNLIQPCATPKEGLRAPLVYLGAGEDEDFNARTVDGCIAVFEFGSGRAWLKAAERGAVGAVFLASDDDLGETTRQASEKFLKLVPLNFPRAYVRDETGAVSDAARAGRTGTLRVAQALRTVKAPVLEAFVPGTQSPREVLVMAHADAQSIAPALSFGGQEAFGPAAWLALFEYFAEHPPAFSLRFVLVSGHWQEQAPARAYCDAIKDAVGEKIAMAVGVDLNPESDALILTDESTADAVHGAHFGFLKKMLFTIDRREPGWIDQLEDLSSRPLLDRGDRLSKYAFYSGRPTMPGNQWALWLAPLEYWPPNSDAVSHPTANQMFTQIGGLSIALKTCNAHRQRHFSCIDTLDPWLPKADNLRPQLELTVALLGGLADLEPNLFPGYGAQPYRGNGGYNRIDVQVVRWNPEIVWYDKKPPEHGRTFVVLVPCDTRFLRGRSYAYWPRPLSPSRFIHRQMDAFATAYVAEAGPDGTATFRNVYSANIDVAYDCVAFTLDAEGRITHAFDQGFHGDAEFHFLDRALTAPRIQLQVPIFPCGALTLFSLVDRDRVNRSKPVENEYKRQGGMGMTQDDCEDPWLPVRNVREVGTHTEADSYAWIQFRDTAMVFLKPGLRCEILAGTLEKKPALFNDDPKLRAELTARAEKEGLPLAHVLAELDADAKVRPGDVAPPAHGAPIDARLLPDPGYLGFRVFEGEDRKLLRTTKLGGEQLARLTEKRLADYAHLNVKSPEANLFQARANLHREEAAELRREGKSSEAEAAGELFWSAEAMAYRGAFRLLLDVVSTTIFYFLLLVPFGYLVERLLFPQPTHLRTFGLAAFIFFAFTGLLYVFHPGFHLASNIFVTVVTFVIVIMTLPALFIIAQRGVAMALEPGAKFKRRHAAGAEKWGVLGAALSLAVNNMRRRRLRTSLTLATITILVTSLVLLTSTAADTSFYREAQLLPKARYRGVQVMNAGDHTKGMNEATVDLIVRRFEGRAHVAVRRYYTPYYMAVLNAFVLPRAKDGEPALPPRAFSLQGAIAVGPQETSISRLDQAVGDGRYFNDSDVRACLLAEETARAQRLKVGDRVNAFGEDLELVGLLRSTVADAELVDLDGKAITPVAFYRNVIDGSSPDHLLAREALFIPEALLRVQEAALLPAYSVVLVPDAPTDEAVDARAKELRAYLETAQAGTLGTATERVLQAAQGTLELPEAERLAALPAGDADALRALAAYNAERRTIRAMAESVAADHEHLDVFLSSVAPPWDPEAQDRVELLSAFARVSLKSGSLLLLPFLVSFLMLLAIMIGNVYERRREIHVFSSVGLAPRHVAGMFLAEALVYAGIASVLGYFLGIILLDVFRRAGWLPENFYPNYFGKVVIWSAVLATSASLLSVLYPMRIASRLVNPSLERIWRIDTKPEGDRWTIHLPFVASDLREVTGMLQFLLEYLGFHRGERSGAFALEVDPELARVGPDPELRGRVWLAPFEQNLVHELRLVPRHDPGKERYHFDLQLRRLSGPEDLWRDSNHAFVDGLRKQMLIWRSLSEDSVSEYVAHGEQALGGIAPQEEAPV